MLVEFRSSDDTKITAPTSITVAVPAKNNSSGKPGCATKVVDVPIGNTAGEVELIAFGGGVYSAPCSVTIKPGKKPKP